MRSFNLLPESPETRLPTVAVLLASYNGVRWLPDQIRSILDQQGVEVQIFISDDGSTDGTREWLDLLASEHQRVILLPKRAHEHSVGSNFLHLIENAPLQGFDAVALSDQDDIWYANKLRRHFDILQERGAAGVSSNVVAVWPSGYSRLLVKSDAQTNLDFVFESAGPGCSFLLHPDFVYFVKRKALPAAPEAREFEHHDWLLYALARSQNLVWVIDDAPCMVYRQHQTNHIGANVGIFPALKRIRVVASKVYRARVLEIIKICKICSPQLADQLSSTESALLKTGIPARFARARMASGFRRRLRDQMALRFFFVLGWW